MTNFPNVAQGAAYNVFVQHYGGRPPYSWTVSAGALPTGLALTNNGFVTGTVDGACVTGAWNFTIRLTDAENQYSEKPFTITVDPAPHLWVARGGSSPPSEYSTPGGVLLGSTDVQNSNGQSMCWDGTYLWLGNQAVPTIIQKYDPATRTRLNSYSIGDIISGGTNPDRKIAFDGTNYWVNSNTAWRVKKFDVNGNVLADLAGVITVGDLVGYLHYDGAGSVIGVNSTGRRIYKINTTTNGMTGPLATALQSGGTSGCTYGGYFYWCGHVISAWPQAVKMLKVRISDLTLISTWDMAFTVNSGVVGSIVTDGTYLYALDSTTAKMWKVRISDGAVMIAPTAVETVTSIYWDGTWIWGVGGGQLRKINPADLSHTNVVAVAGAISVVATKVLPYP